MRKSKALRGQVRADAEKHDRPRRADSPPSSPPSDGIPSAKPPGAHSVPADPPPRRPWLLATATIAMIAWLAILVWMALSGLPTAS
jgi:hypothetical protein